MKIFKKFTTGSPILDATIAGILSIVILGIVNHILKMKINFSLLQMLSIRLNVPLWILFALSLLSIISLKRYLCGPNLKKILARRKYRLIYNATDGRNKEIGFGSNGEITTGRNDNEFSWRISWRKLEILGADGKLYSRFRYDKETDKFYLINGPHNRSLPDQVIEPIIDGVTNWAERKRNS